MAISGQTDVLVRDTGWIYWITDPGSGTGNESASVATSAGDVGAGADQVSGSVATGSADLAGSAEFVQLALAALESGVFLEVDQAIALALVGDVGTGVDQVSLALSSTDLAASAEGDGVGLVAPMETGFSSDLNQPILALVPDQDQATGLDLMGLVAMPVSESGTAIDAGESIESIIPIEGLVISGRTDRVTQIVAVQSRKLTTEVATLDLETAVAR